MHLKDLKIAENIKSRFKKVFSDFNFNEYIDRYILKLRDLIGASLNPMILEPIQTSFNYGIWFFKFNADLLLDNTKLYHLNEVTKSGLPSIKYKKNTLYLSWKMLFPKLEMISYYKLTLNNNSSKVGEISVKVKNLLSDVEFRCDLDEFKPTLNRLKLHTDNALEIQLTGDYESVSILLKTVSNIFKNQILETVEDSLKEIVQEALEGMPLEK